MVSSSVHPPAFAKSGRMERWLAAVGAALVLAGSTIVWYFDPTKAQFFPACPLYSMTGLACPGCGLTRGFHALLHGDLLTAIDYNALIPVFLLILGVIFVSLVMIAARGRGFLKLNQSPKLLVGFLALLIVFGVLRNLPFYPFTFLYP